MIEGMITLASAGLGIGSMLDSLAEMGFFNYVLPFLLIFALVYGILLKTRLFEKNAINGIIALAVALMAIQMDIVPVFFSQIFPRLGVGLAIVFVILIIMGLFLPNEGWVGYVLFGVSAITILVILYQSSEGFGSGILYWIGQNWTWMVAIVVILMIISAIMGEKKERTPKSLGEILPNLKYTG